MKQIINGKRYNTETATKLGEWWNGLSTADFGHVSEVLYKTGAGAYFLHGAGGARSRYAEPCGNCFGGGVRIVPLTTHEALEWCEQHGKVDVIEQHFADQVQDA